MTKQEEIKKVIEGFVDDECLYPHKVCEFYRSPYCYSSDGAYQCLMTRLNELGVVIKVDATIESLIDNKIGLVPTWLQEFEKEAGY